MMTVKNLFENEELLKNIVEDLDDIPEDTKVVYDVWVLRQKADGTVNELLLMEFNNPDDAVHLAKNWELIQIEGAEVHYPHMSIEVETVIPNTDEDDGSTMNIGTIYRRDLLIDGEPVINEDADPTVELKKADIEWLETGETKVSYDLLKNFNNGDYVNLILVDGGNYPILYKIVSKVGEYYHCEHVL